MKIKGLPQTSLWHLEREGFKSKFSQQSTCMACYLAILYCEAS